MFLVSVCCLHEGPRLADVCVLQGSCTIPIVHAGHTLLCRFPCAVLWALCI